VRSPSPIRESRAAPAAPTTGPARSPSSARRRRTAAVYGVLTVAMVVVLTASMFQGAGSLGDPHLRSTLLLLRASRVAAAGLVGASLAVGGVIVQGLFRNPLADVSLIGTSAGAMLGGNASLLAIEFVLQGRGIRGVPPDVVLPVGCLAGALFSLALLLMFLRRSSDVLSLILAGFLFSSLFLSVTSLVTSMAQERWELGRAVISLTLGGVATTGPLQIALAAPLVFSGLLASWFWAKPLDVLLSGDEEAASLGVDVARVRRYCILWVAVLTAGAVALGGNIAFVGLLVPHALRPFLGVEHRRLVPVSAVAGATFVAACDLLARVLPGRSEVPLGVITGLVGAPAFLVLLSRSQRGTAS
jgi:iron complex transport system permease protein